MQQTAKNQPNTLADFVASCVDNPFRYVMGIFPWGEKGTPLANETGPDVWQMEVLHEIGSQALTVEAALQVAVGSGHGSGKSALIAWIIKWFISTRPHPQIVVTANTKKQLEQKTWREIAKWNKMALDGDWFEWTATKFYLKGSPDTWFAAAVPWTEQNSEAFAGTHETYVLVVFDESSKIADIIWEVTEGAMTTKGAIWIAFGNLTRATGRFRECFGKYKHRWITRQIDSRTCKMANKAQIQQWIDDYGEDSDFVRVRVKGEVPRSGSDQFIPSDIVEAAGLRELKSDAYSHAPKVLGVDVARFGEDQTVFCVRQGLHIHKLEAARDRDTMWTASKAAKIYDEEGCTAVFIDDTGVGGGVTDRLKQLGYKPIPVNAGEKALESGKYFNLRAEMWDKLRLWLVAGGSIPNDPELKADITGPEYGFDAKERLQLEKKEDMKKRGLSSPDKAESIIVTFAQPVKMQTKKKTVSQIMAGVQLRSAI